MRKNFIKIIFGFALLISANTALAGDVSLTIRSGDEIIFSGTVAVPTEIATVRDSDNEERAIEPNSALAVLLAADAASDAFEVSEVNYFSSFGSLYLKCITAGSELCDDWQYVVNGDSPGESIDQKTISGGDSMYFYFGPTSRIELSSSAITSADNLTVFAQKYDYENNAWVIRTGITVGLTQPNPDDPFSPLEIATSEVNSSGQSLFSGLAIGTYDVGIKEDFYFPTEQLTVSEAAAPASSSGSSSSGGGGGSRRKKSTGEVLGAEVKPKWNLPKAFEFLLAQQKEDGSFGASMYTDWAALAIATGNNQKNAIGLVKHLAESKLEKPALTDYERRAMALMALGLNPYNTNGVNYIGEIIKTFDGAQFGDENEGNDDIFALIALQNAGFPPEEEMLQKSAGFIIGLQKENGSWYESVDMTGAAIVALANQKNNEKVAPALEKAKGFLKEAQSDWLNGSWNNSASSTAWAMEGLKALGEDFDDWKRDGNTPLDFLATLQDADGGIKNENPDNRLWETAYAVSAASATTWNGAMQKFEKQELPAPPEPKKKPAPALNLPAPEDAILETAEINANQNPPQEEEGWFKKLISSIFGS